MVMLYSAAVHVGTGVAEVMWQTIGGSAGRTEEPEGIVLDEGNMRFYEFPFDLQ